MFGCPVRRVCGLRPANHVHWSITRTVRGAHAGYFAGQETDVMALWDSPHQREAYEWFAVELANLRTAFRWAADQNDLDAAAAIAGYGGLLGYLVEN